MRLAPNQGSNFLSSISIHIGRLNYAGYQNLIIASVAETIARIIKGEEREKLPEKFNKMYVTKVLYVPRTSQGFKKAASG